MKKVSSILILTSLFAVLIVPTIASAVSNCSNWQCQAPVGGNTTNQTIDNSKVPCLCGTEATINNANYYCWSGYDNGKGKGYFVADDCRIAAGIISGGTGGTGGTTGGTLVTGTSITNVNQLIAKIETIYDYVFRGLIALAGVFLVVAGYYFVTGGSEPEKITKGRQMLINALIGVAIAVLGKGLVNVVGSIVG